MDQSTFSNSENTVISKFYENVNKDDTIVISFNNNRVGFVDCLRYYLNNNKKYERTNVLNIQYSHNDNVNYFININDLQNINTYLNFFKTNPNHIIVNSLSTNFTDENIKYSKIETNTKNISISDWDIMFKIQTTSDLDDADKKIIQNLKYNDKHETYFELTDSILINIYDDSNCTIIIEFNSITKSNSINKLKSTTVIYDIVIKINIKNKLNSAKHNKLISMHIFNILKIINRSNIVIRHSYKNEVLLKYSQQMFKRNTIQQIFGSRKPIAVDIRAVVYEIPKMYSVTDKADGERHLLYIDKKDILMISSNLEVKHTGIILSNTDYDKTIIDGELIINNKVQLFLSFDILFLKNTDLRQKYNLSQRLAFLYKFMKGCFNILVNNTNPNLTNMSDITTFYEKSMNDYINTLNKTIQTSQQFIVWYKYYILPKGIQENEIYIYTNILWKMFTSNVSKLPYTLDGVIFTPINREYRVHYNNTNKANEKNIHEYKLKPMDKMSIDFYIEFEKNKKTGEFVKIFDKTMGDSEYYKCYLFVNDTSNHLSHLPVPFRKDYNGHFTYIPIINNVAKDQSGSIISDKTVIEFTYNNTLPEYFRWIPLKIRTDKTETIIKYKKNYGNNMLTASYTWEIITNPIAFNDISILATGQYNEYIEKLKISLKDNVGEQYYDHKTGLVLPMRAFHNYIKNNLISIYCQPYIVNSHISRKNVLDIGIGRGGDLTKLYGAGINKVVGIDIDDSSFNIPNGTYDKFKKLKLMKNSIITILTQSQLNKSIEGVFIKADSSHELTATTQSSIISDMSDKNKELITKHIENNKFDVVNCQFMIHYMFETEQKVKSFFNNINKLLKSNGYLLITCFDGQSIVSKLDQHDGTFEINYTNEKGSKVDLFKITKHYKDDELDQKFGQPVNVMNNLYSSIGKIEYLVMKDTLINYASEFGNLELVESESFYNFYEMNRSFISYIKSNNDYNDKIKGIINNLYKFYNFENVLDQDSLEFSKLNRYYVFRKR